MVKLLALDVDGTLTDGSVILGDGGTEFKSFCVKDGLIISALPKLGIKALIITGRHSEAVERPANELGTEVLQNCKNKVEALTAFHEKNGITFANTAYIGDDLNDYAAMRKCGWKGCPADAAPEVAGICDYVSDKNGGHGAVRDICGVLLERCGLYKKLTDMYEVSDEA